MTEVKEERLMGSIAPKEVWFFYYNEEVPTIDGWVIVTKRSDYYSSFEEAWEAKEAKAERVKNCSLCVTVLGPVLKGYVSGYEDGCIAGAKNKKLEKENEQLKAQIENMKNCANCGHFVCNENDKKECGYYYKDWIMRR